MARIRRRQRRPPVEHRGGGRYALNIATAEIDFMVGLLEQLRELLETAPADDPRVRRLFPVAYPDDPASDAEYQRLMHDDLVRSKLTSITAVRLVLDGSTGDTPAADEGGPIELDGEQVGALMQGINGLRLVLGTLLDVSEDEDPSTWPDDHPLAGEHHLYSWLSWLLEWTVQALSDGMTESTSGGESGGR